MPYWWKNNNSGTKARYSWYGGLLFQAAPVFGISEKVGKMKHHIVLYRFKIFLIWSWPILSCLISGLAAVILHCSNGVVGINTFISYALPFPAGPGTFHIPTLIISTLILHTNRVTPRRWQTFFFMVMAIIGLTLVFYLQFTFRQTFVWFSLDLILAFGITLLPGKKTQTDQIYMLPEEFPDIEETVYAGFWRRFGAFWLDLLIMILIINCAGDLNYIYKIVPLYVFSFFYFIYCVKRWGGTPGKLIAKIKIVKESGENSGWNEAVLRFAVNLFILAFLMWTHLIVIFIMGNCIVILCNKRKRALHDFIVSTVVIKKKYEKQVQQWHLLQKSHYNLS